ncbi:hypothetical protein [Nonomuraea deserti]|uniref:hypothetical protein n=1 Tax=Nonomuraea deserti TaxID=1848322 RepID=UPI001404FCA4|nr:hypothetical protein [Nonomuraea deserti]
MHILTGLADRLVERLVPQVRAAASSCWEEYRTVQGWCQYRRCCTYETGTRCNGWSYC